MKNLDLSLEKIYEEFGKNEFEIQYFEEILQEKYVIRNNLKRELINGINRKDLDREIDTTRSFE